MFRRSIVLAIALASLLSVGIASATASSDVDSAPFDATPQYEYNEGGESGGHELTVGHESPRADGVSLEAGCHFTTVGKPNTNHTVVALAGHAQATSLVTDHGRPISVGVTCTVYRVDRSEPDGLGDAVLSEARAASGPAVVIAKDSETAIALEGADEVTYGELTICTSVSAFFSGGTFFRTETRCVAT